MNTASLQRASMFFSPKISLSSFRELTNQTTDPSITPASGDHKKEIKSGWKHFLLWFILLYYCLSSSQQNNRKQQQKRTIKKSPWKLWAVFFKLFFIFIFCNMNMWKGRNPFPNIHRNNLISVLKVICLKHSYMFLENSIYVMLKHNSYRKKQHEK